MYLTVVIPAYNEEARIAGTLAAIYTYLCSQSYEWEIVVVIDGATDDTLGQVKAFAQGKPQLRWIDRKVNRGKGFTVRQGMLSAKGRIRLFSDADNSTDITHFDKMIPLFQQGADVVIGSRDGKDAHGARQAKPQPFLKRTLGNLGNLLIQIVAVPGIWDTQCGFKAFTDNAADAIFSVALIDRWGFDIEALALARAYSFRIDIIPTLWIDAAGTHVKSLDYLDTIIEALRVRWNLVTGAYRRPTRSRSPK